MTRKPLPPGDPSAVFRWLPRAQRAEYVRAMHGTYAVASRDFGRAWDRLIREIARALGIRR